MSARRRRRRAAGTSVDKWRNKYWLDVQVPDYIGDDSLGMTPASDLNQVIGRTVKISLMDLTDQFNDLNYHLTFKITKITGNKARTEFYGQTLSRDYRRSQIRNHRSQVDGVFNLSLSDDSRVRVTTFVVTPIRAPHNTKKEIRKAVREQIEQLCSELTFPAFVNKLISYELRDEILPAAEEVFPIKLLEIAKVKVVRLPEDRQMEDPTEKTYELEREDIDQDDDDETEEEEEE